MAELHTHMAAEPFEFTDTTMQTKEQMLHEQNRSYLAALVREKQGLETLIEQDKNADEPSKDKQSLLEQRLADCKTELERVSDLGGPRSKIRK